MAQARTIKLNTTTYDNAPYNVNIARTTAEVTASRIVYMKLMELPAPAGLGNASAIGIHGNFGEALATKKSQVDITIGNRDGLRCMGTFEKGANPVRPSIINGEYRDDNTSWTDFAVFDVSGTQALYAVFCGYANANFNITKDNASVMPALYTKSQDMETSVSGTLLWSLWRDEFADEPLAYLRKEDKSDNVRLIAHRGAMNDAPENTLKAFEIAGQQGFWGIEFDVMRTSDDNYVVFHDRNVERMTDGTGNIDTMTLAQVEALTIDAGADVDVYNDLKIPTLDETLKMIRRFNSTPVMELKSDTIFVKDVAPILEITRANGLVDKTVFISFSENLCDEIKRLEPSARIWLVYNGEPTTELINRCSDKGFGLDATVWSTTSVAYASKMHVETGMWAATNTTQYRQQLANSVDYITTNGIEYCIDTMPIYTDGEGFDAYSEYEMREIFGERILRRQLPGATGLDFSEVVNNITSGVPAGRGFMPKVFKLNGATSVSYNISDTKYDNCLVTMRFFDKDHKQLRDTGWLSHANTSFAVPAEAVYFILYFGVVGANILFTPHYRSLMVEMARTFSLNFPTGSSVALFDAPLDSNGNIHTGGAITPTGLKNSLYSTNGGVNITGALRDGQTTTTPEASIAIGESASVSNNSIAIGRGSVAKSEDEPDAANNTAIGVRAYAYGPNAVAIGYRSLAYDDEWLSSPNSTAIGASAFVDGANNVALGYHAVTRDPNRGGADDSYAAFNGVAIGADSFSRSYSVVVGAEAKAGRNEGWETNGRYSVAIGYNATSTQSNEVVLGANSEGGGVNTVSVGNTTVKRKIVNVADGTSANDAVTKQQLDAAIAALQAQIDALNNS